MPFLRLYDILKNRNLNLEIVGNRPKQPRGTFPLGCFGQLGTSLLAEGEKDGKEVLSKLWK